MYKDLMALFFPNHCYRCGEILHMQQKYFCFPCEHQMPRFDNSRPSNNIFHDRLFNKINVLYAFSYYSYQKESPVQELIHDLKYAGMKHIGAYYGHKLGMCMAPYLIEKPSMLIPVPLYGRKLRKRGYNQSLVIAKAMAATLQLPLIEEGVYKKRNSGSQTLLNRLARWKNVQDVFCVEKDLEGQHILLVDDIFTTGATIEALANACLKANCGKISVATLGIAI